MSLTARALSLAHDRRVIARGIELDVPPGRTIGLLGPSGIGKSTLARVLAGLDQPATGSVSVDGGPTGPRAGGPSPVQLLFQSPRRSCSPRMTLAEVICESTAATSPDPALCEEVGLDLDLLGRRPGQVSDGQLQRAALARCLAASPRYLVCDEATAMLDPITGAGVVRALRRRAAAGLGVLAISHDRDLLEAWADEVWELTAEGLERI